MIRRSLIAMALVLGTAAAAHAGSIRVENNDSVDHTIELKCSGSSATVKIQHSTTSTYTFHSTSNECDIVGGSIAFPVSKLENGKAWKIKDGKANPN